LRQIDSHLISNSLLAHMLPTESWTGSFFRAILLECEGKKSPQIRQRWGASLFTSDPMASDQSHPQISWITWDSVYGLYLSLPFFSFITKKAGIRPLMTNHRTASSEHRVGASTASHHFLMNFWSADYDSKRFCCLKPAKQILSSISYYWYGWCVLILYVSLWDTVADKSQVRLLELDYKLNCLKNSLSFAVLAREHCFQWLIRKMCDHGPCICHTCSKLKQESEKPRLSEIDWKQWLIDSCHKEEP